ncbi:unnamed protein product [Clonostachys rosea f. rosea IK726]|uniref:Tachykinin family protein n=2 Tax=Bionectria ochroleuca TaxID=29856 RepID=A0A0B7KBN6_BIOOC|nr:unnamed protein product [Clonostachys rosea f. rosea IK726]
MSDSIRIQGIQIPVSETILDSMDLAPTEIVFSLPRTTDPSDSSTEGQYSYLQGPVKVPGPWKRGRPRAAKPKKSAFQFVSVSGKTKYMDSASQSTIRSHARRMTPRHNIGRDGHYRPPVKKPIANENSFPPLEVALRGGLLQIPGVDPFNTSCITLEPYMHDLLSLFSSRIWRSIYTLEEIGGWNPIENYWLPLAFQDPALLHSFIACADAYVNGYMSEQKGSGRHEHWRTHMKGLKVLVELYGGLETMDSEPLVLHKIYRADLYGSLDAGEPPFFRGPNDIISAKYSTSNIRSEGLNEICKLLSFDPVLSKCIRQLEGVEGFWPRQGHLSSHDTVSDAASHGLFRSPCEIAQVRLILTNTQYKLVSAANSPPIHLGSMKMAIFEFLRITLVIYTLTVLKERPQSTFIGQRIALKLYQALIVVSEEATISGDLQLHHCSTESTSCSKLSNTLSPASPLGCIVPPGFILWGIFFAIINLPPGNGSREVISIKRTLLKIFTQLVQSSGMGQQDVKFHISKYLWIENAHGALFDHFWSDF